MLDQISRDLQDAFPNVKGFSTTNLKYMRRFYELYQNALDDSASFEISAQAVPELSAASENEIGAQAVHQISLNELASCPIKLGSKSTTFVRNAAMSWAEITRQLSIFETRSCVFM